MRLFLSSFLALTLSLSSAAWAESGLDAGAKKQLARVEHKYFGHSFDNDSNEDRASRLEQLIFGESNNGDAVERIKKIIDLSPAEEVTSTADDPAAPAPSRKKSVASNKPASGAPALAPPRQKPKSPSLMQEDEAELRDYPHITALEKTILGKTFVGQPLSMRLAQLETKAFGNPSNLPDLSQRTDALEDYAENKLHQKPFGVENEIETATVDVAPNVNGSGASGSAPPVANQPDYPHITALEKAIVGQTFVGQELGSRLGRLETTAFGKPTDSPDFSQRTDALDKYAAKKLHKKPFAEQQQQEAETANARSSTPQQNAGGPGGSAKALAMVANTLLSAAGMGMGPMGMMNPAMGMGGMGRGGMGRGGGGRFGQKQQEAAPQPALKEDDPEVFTALPPPQGARMLVKVGWCEVKVFGHTFQSMHLTDRLRQLSQKLDFETNKSSLELMDDIGGIIKVVQAQKGGPSAVPIGSANQAATH